LQLLAVRGQGRADNDSDRAGVASLLPYPSQAAHIRPIPAPALTCQPETLKTRLRQSTAARGLHGLPPSTAA